jgi:hypothetical protein
VRPKSEAPGAKTPPPASSSLPPRPAAAPVTLRRKDEGAPGVRHLPPEVVAARRLAEKPVANTAGPTIFGEDLISEKSLDEVILSYLSGEGEEKS